jgi:hypothetical protein
MRTRRSLALVLVGLGSLAGGGVVAAVAASATPSPVALVFDGAHHPGIGPTNLHHEGRFTASAPVCSSGYGTDVQFVYPAAMLREYRCDDGSGSFTALVDSIVAEHGGPGVWKIMGGSGRYAKLRGMGTFASEFVSGSPSEEASIAFRSTWVGLAAFDDLAPEIEVIRASAAKLRRPQGTYVLRLVLSVRDDLVGNAVEYLVLPSSGSTRLPFREGRTTSGAVSFALRIRPLTRERRILVEIRATDPVGNERRIVRSVKLPA